MLIKELETRVSRTYTGGALLDRFLGRENGQDSFCPEDWISSFLEAKNKDPIPNEGITRVEGGRLITEVVREKDFGQGRREPGVLIKLLDSAERLGIQVHPTDAFAQRLFGCPYGKTECWHILDTRTIGGIRPKIYLGFKPYVTKEVWETYYRRQDVAAMLAGMHEIYVQPGDTILVRGGMPHAIGAGCLLLEIQQPSDYTMRCETRTPSGQAYAPQQIHYGAGEAAMLDCFDYTPMTREALEERCLLTGAVSHGTGWTRNDLVTYEDTPYFALSRLDGSFSLNEPMFVTLVSLKNAGELECEGMVFSLRAGDRFLATANSAVQCRDGSILVCYPPRQGSTDPGRS